MLKMAKSTVPQKCNVVLNYRLFCDVYLVLKYNNDLADNNLTWRISYQFSALLYSQFIHY